MAYGNATAIMTTMTALSVARTGNPAPTPQGQQQVCVFNKRTSRVVRPCITGNASDPHSPARHPQTRHTHHTRPHSQASQGRASHQGSHPKSAPQPNVTAEPTPPQTKAAKPSPIDTSDLGPAMRVVGQDEFGNDITVPDTPTLSKKASRQARHEAAKAQDYSTLTEAAQCFVSIAIGTTLAGPLGGAVAATMGCLPTAGAAKAEEPRSCEGSQLEYGTTTYNSDRPNFATIFAKTPIKTGNCYALVLNQLYRENIITKPDVQTFFTNLRARGSTGQAYNELLFPFLQQFGTTTHFREPESLKQSWDAGKIPSGSLIGFLKHTDGSIFHIGRTCHDQYSKPQMQHLLRERLQNLNGVFFSDPQPLIDSAKGKDGQFFVIQLHHPARTRHPDQGL